MNTYISNLVRTTNGYILHNQGMHTNEIVPRNSEAYSYFYNLRFCPGLF